VERSVRVVSAPANVRMAFWLWIAAIVTAILELVFRFVDDSRGLVDAVAASGPELALRFAAYALLLALATLMLRGGNIVRHLLIVIFGVFGTLSLVMEPIGWITDGGNVSEYLTDADWILWVIILSRIAHIIAVLGAVIFAYRGDSNAYFRGDRSVIGIRG
jgi:hypothetical protein